MESPGLKAFRAGAQLFDVAGHIAAEGEREGVMAARAPDLPLADLMVDGVEGGSSATRMRSSPDCGSGDVDLF